MVACLVLIAGLCFSGSSVKADVMNFGLGYVATVTGDHYMVRTGAGDVVFMHDFRKAPKACADGVCVRYFKWCETVASAEIECTYAVIWPGVFPDGAFMVHADSEKALATAEKDVAIVVERDGKTEKVPLSALNVRGTKHDLVDCPSTANFAICNPP